MTQKHRIVSSISTGSRKKHSGDSPDKDKKRGEGYRGSIPIEDPAGIGRRRRVLEYLFTKAGMRVKPSCLQCGQPFLIERSRFDPDNSSYCPTCKPRYDHAPNAGATCDCGAPTAIIVYLTIHHPGTSETSPEPFALCYLCAIDELLCSFRQAR